MSGFFMPEIFRDAEVYNFLKSRFGDRIPPPPVHETPLEPEKIIAASPSPTYSFSSISDEEAIYSYGDCDSSDEEPTPTRIATTTNVSAAGSSTPGSDSLKKNEYQRLGDKSKLPTVPSLFLQVNNKKWVATMCLFHENTIKLKYYRRTPQGIKLNALTFEDYEEVVKILREQKVSFCISEDRFIHAIIRSEISSEFTCDDITQLLMKEHATVNEVYRLGRGSDGCSKIFDIFIAMVKWNAAGRRIFQLESLWNLAAIQVDKSNQKSLTKCSRCHLYGHFGSPCTLPLMCDHCYGDHVTADCMITPARHEPLHDCRPLTLDSRLKPTQDSRNISTASSNSKSTNRTTAVTGQNIYSSQSATSTRTVVSSSIGDQCNPTMTTKTSAQAPILKPTSQDMTEHVNLSILIRFIEWCGGIDDLSSMYKLMLENKGNSAALLQVGAQYAPLVDKLASFRINPETE